MPANKHDYAPSDNIEPSFLFSKVASKPSTWHLLLGSFHSCSALLHFYFTSYGVLLFFLSLSGRRRGTSPEVRRHRRRMLLIKRDGVVQDPQEDEPSQHTHTQILDSSLSLSLWVPHHPLHQHVWHTWVSTTKKTGRASWFLL